MSAVFLPLCSGPNVLLCFLSISNLLSVFAHQDDDIINYCWMFGNFKYHKQQSDEIKWHFLLTNSMTEGSFW